MIQKGEVLLDYWLPLANMKVGSKVNGLICWPYSSKVAFTVKVFYVFRHEGSNSCNFPLHIVWKSEAAVKACFFL